MCNDYGNRIPYSAYIEAFSQLKVRVAVPGGAPNLEPRDDIWPTDVAPIIRSHEDGVELIQLRWGFPAARPKGPPVINMRSEGRRFPCGRCLVPASHFYDWQEIAQGQMAFYQEGRRLAVHRRTVAPGRKWRGFLCDVDM